MFHHQSSRSIRNSSHSLSPAGIGTAGIIIKQEIIRQGRQKDPRWSGNSPNPHVKAKERGKAKVREKSNGKDNRHTISRKDKQRIKAKTKERAEEPAPKGAQ